MKQKKKRVLGRIRSDTGAILRLVRNESPISFYDEIIVAEMNDISIALGVWNIPRIHLSTKIESLLKQISSYIQILLIVSKKIHWKYYSSPIRQS